MNPSLKLSHVKGNFGRKHQTPSSKQSASMDTCYNMEEGTDEGLKPVHLEF